MTESLTTWRKELSAALAANGESWDDVETMTLTDAQLDREFDSEGDGADAGKFKVWTAKWIYFLARRDDPEWVSSVPRHQGAAKVLPY